MNGAPASPLPPSIIFDSESAPDWFVRYRDEEKTKQTKLQARIDELEKSLKLAQGFRLDGPREVKIGTVRFTETETGILRSLAGVGCAMKEVHGNALYRHASNIRKKLREAGVDPSAPTSISAIGWMTNSRRISSALSRANQPRLRAPKGPRDCPAPSAP